jgi:excinuclease ABC subunit C
MSIAYEIRRPRPPAQIRADVREGAENRPGVYRMVGPGGDVLYVGKSVRVRARVLSYFRAPAGEKAAEIIAHTHHVQWEYVPSEFAALLHEMRLIREHRPPFNVQHKRDRAFCFIKLTREPAPRLLTVFEVKDDGAAYFGPFHGPLRVRDVVREVADVLELRNCAGSTPVRFADQLDLFSWERSPLCLRADVNRCLAPCAGRCTRAEYQERVVSARNFLNGDADTPLAILRDRMDVAAHRMNFEYAAHLRDRIDRLETARQELLILRGIIESLSFVYQPNAWESAAHVYLIRRGIVHEECPAPRNEEERERVIERARALFRPRRHTTAVRPTQAAEILLLARWFRLRPGELDNVWDSPSPDARSRLAALRALG